MSPLANFATIYGVVIELVILVLVVYTPGLQEFMGAAPVSWEPWLIAFSSAVVLLMWTEMIKYLADHHNSNWLVKVFYW